MNRSAELLLGSQFAPSWSSALRSPSKEKAEVRGGNFQTCPASAKLPSISPLMLGWFTWYCRRYIQRHFHSLRVSRSGLPPDTRGLPLVVFTNHASWWDPLVGLVLKETFFADRKMFAPIDAAMLQRYRMFASLGFFGVEQGTRRGAVQFLRASREILQSANHLLAITPQSRFADVRERPLGFQSGLGRLASQAENTVFLPMVTEFVFWEERLPEILVRFGEPVLIHAAFRRGQTPDDLSAHFEAELSLTLDALAVEAQRRDSSDFHTILRGSAGQGGIYDWWRGLKARLRGEAFAREHGRK